MAYSPEEVAAHKAAILERIADGESLRAICEGENTPARSLVFEWLAADASFADQYAHAREEQADALFDEILDIADDGRNDWMKRNHGEDDPAWVENGEALNRSRIRIDARKWMAGKLRPKKYGDRVDGELTLKADETITGLMTRVAAKGARLIAPQEDDAGATEA